MIYLLKKAVALLTSPLGLFLVLLAIGLLWSLWRRRRKKSGPGPGRVILAATLGLILISIGPTGDLLINPLENRHPPLTDLRDVENGPYIVVLGGGLTRHTAGPLTSELNDASAIRLMEGLRLYHQLPDSRLIVGGAGVGLPRATADAMGELAIELGVDPQRLFRADGALDTSQEAQAVAEIAGSDQEIILVTEASHMPRAMILFARAGLQPTPAPTYHRGRAFSLHPGAWWPSAKNIRSVERAIYEYIALVWIHLGGS